MPEHGRKHGNGDFNTRSGRHLSVSPVTLSGNSLIDALPPSTRAGLLSSCDQTTLQVGECLSVRGLQIDYIYFPLGGFASLLLKMNGHKPMDINMIGNEGMVGSEIILGRRIAPYTCLVKGSGTALKCRASSFQKRLDSSPPLRSICSRYVAVLIEQMTQSIGCNCFHDVSQRLARWLLMAHDRAIDQKLELTHAFLAGMLGVRRSAVTIAAGHLQQQQLIRYSRGRIWILSRSGLQAESCECYSASILSYKNGIPEAGIQ